MGRSCGIATGDTSAIWWGGDFIEGDNNGRDFLWGGVNHWRGVILLLEPSFLWGAAQREMSCHAVR